MINHYVGVQVRVLGTGNLRPRLYTLGNAGTEVFTKTLVPVIMSTSTDKSPIVLANVRKEQVFLELTTMDVNEGYIINKIDIFVKPVGSGGPQ